jgi:hypothetical protein
VHEIWTPTREGPHEAFVARVHRVIERFAEQSGVATPLVEIELADSSRFTLDRIEPEPGFGMVTIYVLEHRDQDAPDAIVLPIGTIRRIELRCTPDERVAQFGFVVPHGDES